MATAKLEGSEEKPAISNEMYDETRNKEVKN